MREQTRDCALDSQCGTQYMIIPLLLFSIPRMAKSKYLIGTLNFVTLLLSIPVIGTGIWLAMEAKNSCVKVLQWPVIILGILIFLVALAGVIGGFRRIQLLIVSYYFGMFIIIILLSCLVVFIRRVSARRSGDPVPNSSYKEYRMNLTDFSFYLRKYQRNNWDKISICLKSRMCAELNQTYRTAQDFSKAHITPMQAGCCTPPKQCCYTFVNPIYWVPSNKSCTSVADVDCQAWTNNQEKLCYECDSCKVGLLQNISTEWKRANLIFIITLVALIIVYMMGCFTLKNAKFEDIFR